MGRGGGADWKGQGRDGHVMHPILCTLVCVCVWVWVWVCACVCPRCSYQMAMAGVLHMRKCKTCPPLDFLILRPLTPSGRMGMPPTANNQVGGSISGRPTAG